MDKLFTVIGLILFISGGIGLLLTNANLDSGDVEWAMGNLTFGTFALVGAILFITLIIASWENQ